MAPAGLSYKLNPDRLAAHVFHRLITRPSHLRRCSKQRAKIWRHTELHAERQELPRCTLSSCLFLSLKFQIPRNQQFLSMAWGMGSIFTLWMGHVCTKVCLIPANWEWGQFAYKLISKLLNALHKQMNCWRSPRHWTVLINSTFTHSFNKHWLFS